MDILSELNRALMPGSRVIRVNGWEQAEKYPIPRDCEVIMLDSDPESDHIYMKKSDVNGSEIVERYLIVEDPIPKFDPEKYVTVDDFKQLKEEMLNGFDSIRQSIAGIGTTTSKSSNIGK